MDFAVICHNMKKLFPYARILMLMTIPLFLMGSSTCKDDNELHGEVMPTDGADNVPVNVVVQVTYPADLALKESQMKKGLFSIHECQEDTFDLTTKEPAKKEPAKTETTTEKKEENKDATAKTEEPKKELDLTGQSSNEPELGTEVKFFHKKFTDTAGNIFNYLMIDPDGRKSPLKPNQTYCVKAASFKNGAGVTIAEQNSTFTTQEDATFQFDTQISPEFFGETLAPTAASKNKEGQNIASRDYVLVYFPNQIVRPEQVKSKIHVCIESEERTTTSTACSDYGKEVRADVFLYDSLRSNPETKLISSNYNVYAVSPKIILTPGIKGKVVLDLSTSTDEEGNIGMDQINFTVTDDSTLSWTRSLAEDIKDDEGEAMSTQIQQLFYMGSSS